MPWGAGKPSVLLCPARCWCSAAPNAALISSRQRKPGPPASATPRPLVCNHSPPTLHKGERQHAEYLPRRSCSRASASNGFLDIQPPLAAQHLRHRVRVQGQIPNFLTAPRAWSPSSRSARPLNAVPGASGSMSSDVSARFLRSVIQLVAKLKSIRSLAAAIAAYVVRFVSRLALAIASRLRRLHGEAPCQRAPPRQHHQYRGQHKPTNAGSNCKKTTTKNICPRTVLSCGKLP